MWGGRVPSWPQARGSGALHSLLSRAYRHSVCPAVDAAGPSVAHPQIGLCRYLCPLTPAFLGGRGVPSGCFLAIELSHVSTSAPPGTPAPLGPAPPLCFLFPVSIDLRPDSKRAQVGLWHFPQLADPVSKPCGVHWRNKEVKTPLLRLPDKASYSQGK